MKLISVGLMAYIWETCHFLGPVHVSGLSNDEEQVFHDTTVHHHEIMASALQAWRENWDFTMESDLSRGSNGIYVSNALSYWGLMCFLSKPNYPSAELLTKDKTSYTKSVLSLMRKFGRWQLEGLLNGICSVVKMREMAAR